MKKRISLLKSGDVVAAFPNESLFATFPVTVRRVLAGPGRSRGFRSVEVVDAQDVVRLIPVGHESGLADVIEEARWENLTTPFKADAYSLDALVEAGVDASDVRKFLVDSRRCGPERAKLTMKKGSKKRTEPTLDYAWGPDVNFLLGLDTKGGAR